MKAITFFIALFTGTAVLAQDYDFVISTARNQSTTTSPSVSTMTISFNQWGSHVMDNQDATMYLADSSVIRPYTLDSANTILLAVDSRPQLRSALLVPFGVMTDAAAPVFITGAWTNPSVADVYDVFLIDNQTGVRHNLYNETSFFLSKDLAFHNQFTILFTPRLSVQAFDATCPGSANGSVYLQSSQENWGAEVFFNSAGMSPLHVSGTDTLITGLSAGTYTFVYYLNSIAVDTAVATISSSAPVHSSATVSNLFAVVNQPVTFTNTSSGALTYLWNFGDGNRSSDASPVHAFTVPGNYTVTLTSYNVFDCSDVAVFVVHVAGQTYLPSQPDRENTQAHNTGRVAAANIESHEGQAQVVAANEIAIAKLTVYTALGQLIYSGNESQFSYAVPGIYIVQITYANGQQESKKVPLN